MKRLLSLLGIGVLLFYIAPLLFRQLPVDSLGLMVIALLVIYPVYSLVAGFLNTKWRWIFPLFIGLLFLPTVYILYNESALVYPVRYTVIAFIGAGLSYLKQRVNNKK